ncbi:uncharacterized protein DS421_12g370350 [Arachis hypogaea]|nr:uncharacterized protein DS421_12g370350 [Arachis hypogaea]
MAARNKTKDLKCATHLLSDKFRNMTEEKKAIVRDLGFGGLMHIPPLRVDHQLLRELANNFKLGENRLKTGYGSFQITPKTIGDALGINATGNLFPEKVEYKQLSDDDKIIYRRFQGKTLKSLTDEMMEIGVGNEEERLMFKRIFILYIQMAFLLPTTINKISPGITDYQEKKKKAIDGCLFALMIIYFHLSENKGKKRAKDHQSLGLPTGLRSKWTPEKESRGKRSQILIQNLNLNQERRIITCREGEGEEKNKNNTKKTQPKKKKVVVEDSPPKEDQYFDGETYEISSDELDEWLRENVDKSAAEGENQADLRSTEGRYVSSEIIPAVNLGSDAHSSQGRTEQSSVNQPSQSMLSPSDSNMMVVRKQTPSEALVIVPIQVFVLASQTTTETDFEPTPMIQIEGTTETHPDAEDAAALLMMARTASYIPKTDPGVPSFSLGLTDSSQEGASTQETERAKSPEYANLIEQLDDLVQKIASSAAKGKNKSPQIQRETGGKSSAKFRTPGGLYQIMDDMKQKCYIWGTRLKEDADGNTNEYEEICTLIAQGEYILMRMHFVSLQAKSDIESQIVSAICLILNQKNEKRFQEQIYCLPPILCYDCAIYVMKWMKLIEPENIKKGKYEWDNWPQEEVDHYRVEYASRILFSEMNKERYRAIRESSAIRLSKPSSVLLSPFCQINSADIETA